MALCPVKEVHYKLMLVEDGADDKGKLVLPNQLCYARIQVERGDRWQKNETALLQSQDGTGRYRTYTALGKCLTSPPAVWTAPRAASNQHTVCHIVILHRAYQTEKRKKCLQKTKKER